MNFEKLLRPYKEGGTKEHRVERTMGTIVDYLVNKKGYPLHVVGGAIFSIFFWLSAGNEFKGDGTFGSKGKELVTSIRMKCDELLREQIKAASNEVFIERFAEQLPKVVTKAVVNKLVSKKKRNFLKWWRGRDEFAQWD